MTERTAIDDYLDALPEAKRSTLLILRRDLRKLLPEAEECISYAMPGFRFRGKMIAGFAAFKNHLSYFPHSGSVLAQVSDDLASYKWSAGTLQFEVGEPLPFELVAKLVAVRLNQAANA